jgi:hypothetical protein
LDLVELVAVDRDVSAEAHRLVASERPQHGERRRRRHQDKHEPQCHGTVLPAKFLELLPETTHAGQ